MSNAKRDKTTYFNDKWLKKPLYSEWLKRVKDDNTRYGCKVCPEKKNAPRTQGDMGGALSKHMETGLHQKNYNQYFGTLKFFKKSNTNFCLEK